jgi:hypothetical protein
VQVPGCLKSCTGRLQSAAAADVSWEDLHAFYGMPDTLRAGVLKQACKVFAAKLSAAFLCLEEAWRDDALRQQFCELPLAAVEALAALDELQVVSENTVATALATWLAHDLEGRLATGQQLLGHIRLQHLSQAYVQGVLPHLPGLGQHLTMQRLLEALRYEKVSAGSRHRVDQLKAMKPPRAQPASTGLSFEWYVSTADLLQLVEEVLQPEPGKGSLLCSSVHWYNGFQLRAAAHVAGNRKEQLYLRIYLAVHSPNTPTIACCPIVNGTAQMPGGHTGAQVSMDLAWCQSSCAPDHRSYVWMLTLGQGAVHNMGTLVAAIASTERLARFGSGRACSCGLAGQADRAAADV